MPIKGLSETVRIPRLGKIRLGIKVPNKSNPEKVHPEAVDYFVLPAEVAPALMKLAGWEGKPEDFKPKELPVMIPLDDEEFWASTWYRRYNMTRGLVCKGDGETCRRMIDLETGATVSRDTKGKVEWRMGLPCQGRDCLDYKSKPQKCQEVMNLQFLMPDIPGLGVWQIDTGSINSIININSAAKLLRMQYGRVWGIPLMLTLKPMEVNNPDDGKKKTVHVLNLEIRGTMHQVAQLIAGSVAMLPSPVPVSPDEEEAPMDTELHKAPTMTDEEVKAMWGDGGTSPKATSTEQPPAPAATATKETTDEKDRAAKKAELMAMKFKTVGDFMQACLTHFKLQPSAVQKETAIYELHLPLQREQAWAQIVGARM